MHLLLLFWITKSSQPTIERSLCPMQKISCVGLLAESFPDEPQMWQAYGPGAPCHLWHYSKIVADQRHQLQKVDIIYLV